jgi:hypothetical protein
VCLNYTGTHYGAKPGTNTATGCSAGTFSNTPADTSIQWNWSCIGINAGTTASCSESRIPPGKLVELHSQYSGKVKNIIQSPYYVSVISSSMYNEVVYCAIRADNGTLECGGGSATFVANAPVGQVIKEMAVNIDWDSNRMCVIKGNDDLYCWGPGGNNLPANKKAKQVSVGKDGLCWINLNDTVECHGSGSGGGFAGANPSAGLTAKSISVSQDYACAIKFDNTSECWTGPNQAGSTGYRLSLWNNNSGSGCSGGGCASSTFKQMFPVEGICGIRMNNTLACTSDSDRAGLGGSTTVSSGYSNFRHSCWFQSSNNHMKCNYSGYPENTNWLSSIYYLDSNAGKGCGIKPNGENICWPYYQDDIGVEIITENQPQPFQVIRRIINSSGVSRGYVLTPI